MRRTKIVCTIGPAISREEQLERLIRASMNVARLNFSHGTQDEHAIVIDRVRAITTRLGCPIAILQDLQGPKIRTGALQGGRPVKLVDGSNLTITTRPILGNAQVISTTYQQLAQDVKPGDRILLDDGLMVLCVLSSNVSDVQCLVVISHAARTLAEGPNVQTIVVFTQSGNSAHLISKERPPTPIYAYTPSERIYRQLALWWGVWPSCIEVQVTTEDLIAGVEQCLRKDKLVQRGAYVVLMGSMPIASQGRTNFVKLHYVGENT